MNKYEKALDACYEYLDRDMVEAPFLMRSALDTLRELVNKYSPKKAIIKTDVKLIYGDNRAIEDVHFICEYHCPCCDNWLSNEFGIKESEELDLYCPKCGQYVKGIKEGV